MAGAGTHIGCRTYVVGALGREACTTQCGSDLAHKDSFIGEVGSRVFILPIVVRADMSNKVDTIFRAGQNHVCGNGKQSIVDVIVYVLSDVIRCHC